MSKITLTNLADLNNSNTAITNINNNNVIIQAAMDNTLSLDGTTPNSMEADLDMNSNFIINLPAAVATGEAVEFNQFETTISALGPAGAASIALNAAVASAAASASSAAISATTSATNVITSATAAAVALAAASSAAISAAAANTSATLILAGGIWNNIQQTILTSNYTVQTTDNTKTLFLGGNGLFTLTFAAPSSYAAKFVVKIANTDTLRAKIINLNGTLYFLWPGNSGFIWNESATNWNFDFPRKWFNNTTGYTFYVDPVLGSDANDGLVAGAGGALLSIQTAIDRLHQYVEPNNLAATVNLADGTYSVGAGINCDYVFGPSEIFITGNFASPQNVIISCNAGGTCFNCQEPATFTFTGMTISTIGNGSTGIFCRQHTTTDLANLIFAAFPLGIQLSLENHGSMNVIGNLAIIGGAVTWLSANDLSFFSATGFNCTISAGLNYSVFVESERNSVVKLGINFQGAGSGAGLTGQQYDCSYNSLLDRSGTTIPGTIAGTFSNNGVVI
jgi:hypothetical protein